MTVKQLRVLMEMFESMGYGEQSVCFDLEEIDRKYIDVVTQDGWLDHTGKLVKPIRGELAEGAIIEHIFGEVNNHEQGG